MAGRWPLSRGPPMAGRWPLSRGPPMPGRWPLALGQTDRLSDDNLSVLRTDKLSVLKTDRLSVMKIRKTGPNIEIQKIAKFFLANASIPFSLNLQRKVFEC
jgi:hypothetical protein